MADCDLELEANEPFFLKLHLSQQEEEVKTNVIPRMFLKLFIIQAKRYLRGINTQGRKQLLGVL